MADVSRRRERGQLILVTGLLVAVTMVALVLLLNTAIYTENLASRGADQSGSEAIEYRAIVVDGVGGLIDAENDREHGTPGNVEDAVRSGIGTIDNLTARSYATGGTVVRINRSSLSFQGGKLIRQTNDSREFQNESGQLDDWTLATDVEDDEIRDFRINVSRDSLESNDDDAFNVYLADGSETWQAFVYRDSPNVTVAISLDGGGSKTDVCSVEASEATIDLTRGTIDGKPCPGLNWSEGISGSYDLEFQNGENATGTYDVTIDDDGASIETTTNIETSSSDTVYAVPAVYSATFNVSYETPSLTYRDEVRVAPGEPR